MGFLLIPKSQLYKGMMLILPKGAFLIHSLISQLFFKQIEILHQKLSHRRLWQAMCELQILCLGEIYEKLSIGN